MKRRSRRGSLTIVGLGIEAITHVTLQARGCIEQADKVLYYVADPVSAQWIRSVNPKAESLTRFYSTKKRRRVTYSQAVDEIFGFLRKGFAVCAAFYGHPGVFCSPGHAAMRRARREGVPARMLPAISSLDCLFADLGVDPGAEGCQSFDATDFLLHDRRFDPKSPLILLQPALIGERTLPLEPCNREGLKILTKALRRHYPGSHKVVVYEAAQFVVGKPGILKVRLEALPRARVTPVSMLYVPPKARPTANRGMLKRLIRLSAGSGVQGKRKAGPSSR